EIFLPVSKFNFEQEMGLKPHIRREMPLFLTLRDGDGEPLATAMLPPCGRDDRSFRPIIVGPGNADPYPDQGDAIRALAQHYGMTLDRARCYPYRRDLISRPGRAAAIAIVIAIEQGTLFRRLVLCR